MNSVKNLKLNKTLKMSVPEARAIYESVLLEHGNNNDETMKALNTYAAAIVRTLPEYDENGEKIIYVVEISINGEIKIETHTDSSIREALIRDGFTEEDLADACERIKIEYPNWQELLYIERVSQ